MKIFPILYFRQVLAISVILFGNSFNSFSLFDRIMSCHVISSFLGFMVSRYVLTIFWVVFCSCWVMIFSVDCCREGHDVDWEFCWDTFFWMLKSTGWGDWPILLWGFSIAFLSFVYILLLQWPWFFPLKRKPLILINVYVSVGVATKAKPLDFPILSHLIISKWLFCLRYLVAFKPKRISRF